MAGMNTLQMIKMIPTFEGRNCLEWTRSFNDILQTTWPFLSKIVSGLKRPEPISRENIGGEETARDIDDNDYSNPSEVSAVGSPNSDEQPSNSDNIEAWDTANEHLLRVRLTTLGPARSVLLKFEPKNCQPGNGR